MKIDSKKVKKFLSRRAVRHTLLAVVIFYVFIFITKLLLGGITKHNKEIEVPDFSGKTVAEAVEVANKAGLEVAVIDSVYIRRLGRGLVYSQTPAAGGKVKSGRCIKVTINAVSPKKVSMPNLVGYSLRQARAELSTRGLSLGRLIYVKDLATNNVLRQLYRRSEIEPGTPVEALSRIDLELGLNPDDNKTDIPNVVGCKYLRAVEVVHDNYLNIKKLIFDKDIKTYSDSLDAIVYKQSPEHIVHRTVEDIEYEPERRAPVLMGSEVTLYLTLDKTN